MRAGAPFNRSLVDRVERLSSRKAAVQTRIAGGFFLCSLPEVEACQSKTIYIISRCLALCEMSEDINTLNPTPSKPSKLSKPSKP